MNHRIQIVVDEKLNKSIKAGAKKLGLSVSSYARLALMNGLSDNKNGLLAQAMREVETKQVDKITYDEFVDQIDELL